MTYALPAFLTLFAVFGLLLSINTGVAAERAKLAGDSRKQWLAIGYSGMMGIIALASAYMLGRLPH